jgi:hypothetical protein
MAMAIWPTRIDFDSAKRAQGNAAPPEASTRITARSVAASRPTTSAASIRPSGHVTRGWRARPTTWLLVRTRPSGVKTTPDPAPPSTSILTTDGPTSSTAAMTASE